MLSTEGKGNDECELGLLIKCPPHRSRARSESPLKQKLTTLLTFCDLDVKNDVEAKKEKNERCSGSEDSSEKHLSVFRSVASS